MGPVNSVKFTAHHTATTGARTACRRGISVKR
jgi:hypothetical protein